MFGSGRVAKVSDHALPSDLASCNTTLIISNEEMNDIIEINKSLEEFGLLIKDVVKQLKMKQKSKKEDFSVCY